jgi:hypothetical protein
MTNSKTMPSHFVASSNDVVTRADIVRFVLAGMLLGIVIGMQMDTIWTWVKPYMPTNTIGRAQ